MSGEDWSSMITVGRVIRPHGHRGQVVVESATDFAADRFREGAVVYALRGEQIEPWRVTASREYDGRWVVGFDRVTSMNDAETLRGQELRIAAADVQQLDEGRFYIHDLVGCRVETASGESVGLVEDVHTEGTATPILEVRGAGREVLVPFVDAICRRVDVTSRLIVIDPPEGLLDDDR